MDDELRQAFATLSAQMSDVGNDARKAAAMAQETAHDTAKIAFQVQGLRADVDQLKVAVFGSTPPPAPMPVVKRITHNEGDIAELAGQVIAVKADIAAVREINEGQSEELMSIKSSMTTNTKATLEIKRELVDGVKSFWQRNPKLESALVGLIFTALGVATAWVAARWH